MRDINPVLDTAVKAYGFNLSQLVPLTGGHMSHVYRVERDEGSYVMRITPPNDDIRILDMQAILHWMQYLARQGGSVPSPIQSSDHSLIEIIQHHGEQYLVVVIESASGVLSEEVSIELWHDELYQVLGTTIGKIHQLASQYTSPNPDLVRPAWDKSINNFNPQINDDPSLTIIRSKREALLDHLSKLPMERDSYGLIHGDLHFGNFFIDISKNKITIFDFDDCAYGWYMMDIATLLFDILVVYQGADKGDLAGIFLLNFLRGYTREKSISPFWINQMPYFLKLLEIGIYLQEYEAYDSSDTVSWVGKFMPARKKRIENDTPYVDINFEEIFRLI